MECEARIKIAVTPAGYDDIGAILAELGEGYESTDIELSNLSDAEFLSQFRIVFINCHNECDAYAPEAEASLRHFVERGGSVYASDWAQSFVIAAFPEYIRFAEGETKEETVTARVTDPGLADLLGREIELNFDASAWRAIEDISPKVKVYLRGSYMLDGEQQDDKPLLVSFRHGDGQVVYTTFHNEAQLSEQERKLLKFLVLRPVTARTSASTTRVLETCRLQQEKETIGAIDPGQSSPCYTYSASEGTTLTFLLAWEGHARLQLTTWMPNGQVYQVVEGDRSPLAVPAPWVQPGPWRYQVVALQAPYRNLAYVLTVGSQPATPSAPVPEVGSPSPRAMTPPVCPRCGALLSRPGARFCGRCGYRL